MRVVRGLLVAGIVLSAAIGLHSSSLVAQSQAIDPNNAKIWIGRAAEIEEYLRTAEIIKVQDTAVGVTHPKKCTLAPGGPVEFLALKLLPAQTYTDDTGNNVRESYKAEIAAYELDKLLKLDMVPPTVEKKYKNQTGAAIMWASPTKSWAEMGGRAGVAPTPPQQYLADYFLMIARAKMYDDLIGDPDTNLGNWLVDPEWHLILIDHSRALTGDTSLPLQLQYIDRELWERMTALTVESITPALGKWLGKGEIKAIIQRRDKMTKVIDDLVRKNGEDKVFIKGSKGGAVLRRPWPRAG